jgi:hypothetical protein
VLHNGLGSYAEAMAAAQRAFRDHPYPDVRHPGVANWAAAELIEAAARSGMSETAADAYRWIAEMSSASGCTRPGRVAPGASPRPVPAAPAIRSILTTHYRATCIVFINLPPR